MKPSLYLITAPDDDIVTLDEAKAQLRITDTSQDDMVTALILSAVGQIDPAFGGWLGRALRPQTWELRAARFPYFYEGSGYNRNFHPSHHWELPFPPLLSVDSVKYIDWNGVEQTLVEGIGFRVFELGSLTRKARIAPLYNTSWPAYVRPDPESVKVQFTCGYEPGLVDTLPQPIKQAILLMVRQAYSLGERNLFVSSETVDNVGAKSYIVSPNADAVMKAAAENLLAIFRVWE